MTEINNEIENIVDSYEPQGGNENEKTASVDTENAPNSHESKIAKKLRKVANKVEQSDEDVVTNEELINFVTSIGNSHV